MESLLRQAWLECKHLAVDCGYQQPGGNQVLSDEIISTIVRSHQPPPKLALPAPSPNVDPVDNDMTIVMSDHPPSRPSLLAPSPKVNPADNEILTEFDFQAFRRAVAVEVTTLRKLALKCLLADAWAVRKPFQVCQMVADKQVQAFFDNVEDHLKAGNLKFFLMPDKGGREIDEENGETGQHLSAGFRSKPEATTLLEDSTIRQYIYLVDGLIRQMTLVAEDSSQVRQKQLLAQVNRIGMRAHLEAFRQWNVEWQRQADDRVERRDWSWHAGPVGIDVRTTEVTYSPGLEPRPSSGRMARSTPERSRVEQQQTSKLTWRNLSKEAKEAIDKLAAQMAESVCEEDKARIRTNMDAIPIQKHETLTQNGVDPLFYYFRTRAMKQYRGQCNQSHGTEEGLVPNKSFGKRKYKAAGLRRKGAENQASRAPLAAIAIPNSRRAAAQPERCGIPRPRRSRTVPGNVKPKEAAIWRQIQSVDNQEQEIAKASRKRRKTTASQAALVQPGSQAEEIEVDGRGNTSTRSVEVMEDTIVVGENLSRCTHRLADGSSTLGEG
jgi:hypothetical protein